MQPHTPTALYDIQKTWEENLRDGPCFSAPYPQRAQSRLGISSFLGHSLRSPLGIAAGPLLNSAWVAAAARLGFDVLTYKTIRSHAHPSHALPNVLFLQCPEALRPGALPASLQPMANTPQNMGDISITNSFGNPSMDPEYLRRDILQARESLNSGQLLVVSVFGSDPEDFGRAAALAVESGALAIEANFSCPNLLKSSGGALYADPEGAQTTVKAIKKAIGQVPLVIKVGLYSSVELMRQVFSSLAKHGVNAISGINTISMPILNCDGTPALSAHRPTAGVCGNAIREAAWDFISQARTIIDQERLDLELVGVGGMTAPQHLKEGLERGANLVQVATGFMWDPFLASRFHALNLEEAHVPV